MKGLEPAKTMEAGKPGSPAACRPEWVTCTSGPPQEPIRHTLTTNVISRLWTSTSMDFVSIISTGFLCSPLVVHVSPARLHCRCLPYLRKPGRYQQNHKTHLRHRALFRISRVVLCTEDRYRDTAPIGSIAGQWTADCGLRYDLEGLRPCQTLLESKPGSQD